MSQRNLTLLTDLYELTMMQGYFMQKDANETVVFDMFYRNNPFGNGFAICAGLEQVIEYIENLHFDQEDVDYLRSTGMFREDFLNYLLDFRFSGDIYAIPEGTVVFPREPLIKVVAPIMEAQLIETALLNIVNHQSLIATKASRLVRAAQGRTVLEFGSRRAQGADGAILGARAAYIVLNLAVSTVAGAVNAVVGSILFALSDFSPELSLIVSVGAYVLLAAAECAGAFFFCRWSLAKKLELA